MLCFCHEHTTFSHTTSTTTPILRKKYRRDQQKDLFSWIFTLFFVPLRTFSFIAQTRPYSKAIQTTDYD